jgi:hypothetical protein
MLTPALLLSAFLAAAPETGAQDTAHPFLVYLKESLGSCFETEGALKQLEAVSLAGTSKADDVELSLQVVDFIVRRQGPGVLKGVVKVKLWPQDQDTRIIQRVERLPPLRKGKSVDPELAEALGQLAMDIQELAGQRPRSRWESEEKWQVVSPGVAAISAALSSFNDFLVPETPRGDPQLMNEVSHLCLARVVMEGETKPVVDTFVGFLNELVKLARKGAPRSR